MWSRRIVERRGIRNRCGRRYGGTHVIAIAPRLRCGSLRFNGKYKVKFHPQIKADLLIFEKILLLNYRVRTRHAAGYRKCLLVKRKDHGAFVLAAEASRGPR
jgi:hypothetical protein